jgi:SAM-dependent methyltransferase
MDATGWDERYAASDSVWGATPNVWVARELADVPPGRALDLACGEGRNALWLAGLGWQVTGVDFSAVAVAKAAAAPGGDHVHWVEADATSYLPDQPMDLALLCYLQLPAAARRAAVRGALTGLAPGGLLLVIAHDSSNLAEGTGGPQDAAVLYTAQDVLDDLAGLDIPFTTERAGVELRTVDGAERPARDALLRVRRDPVD